MAAKSWRFSRPWRPCKGSTRLCFTPIAMTCRLQTAIATFLPHARMRIYSTDEDLRAWNAGEVDLLLAHPASCCYGLNLQGGGHHVIWFGLTWSLEQYQQANKRLHRQGQPWPVIVHHLVVQGGMDEDVIQSLQAKDRSQEALLQALKARIDRATGGQRV